MALLLLSACTRHVEVSAVKASRDLSGLRDEERQRPWAAFDVVVPASVARSIRRWQLSNVSFQIFRCNDSGDYYPAEARVKERRFHYTDLKEPLPSTVTLSFYAPLDQGHRETNVCGALDARGYSPIFLRSQTVRLPPMDIIFYHYDEQTGRWSPI